jgi:hypothetical protein|tara:strand:- start:612 stop:839 length:228 start_codon:yes stop_codon:yes gene_type:complete
MIKYIFLSLILILPACSLDKNSSYWNEVPINKTLENKKITIKLQKDSDFKTMTFEEFNFFVNEYSNNSSFPNIDN